MLGSLKIEATEKMVLQWKSKRAVTGMERARNSKRKELIHEIDLGTLNTKHYRKDWHEASIKTSIPDVEKKLEHARSIFDCALDLKDYRIAFLMDAVEKAKEQRRNDKTSRVRAVDRSLEAYEDRLRITGLLFSRTLETVFAERSTGVEKITRLRNDGEALLRKIGLHVNEKYEKLLNGARSTVLSKIDAFIEDARNERRTSTTRLAKRLSELWNELRCTLLDYQKNTEQRRKTYKRLEKRDKWEQKAIEQQCRRTEVLCEEIARIRSKITLYGSDSVKELQQMKQESKFFCAAYRETNERFILDRRMDKYDMAFVSMEYRVSVTRLDALACKAKRILALLQTCRKYETQSEKILPVTPLPPLRTYDSSIRLNSGEYEKFIVFWRRLNVVRTITRELRMEKDRLLLEADHLKNSVKHHLPRYAQADWAVEVSALVA